MASTHTDPIRQALESLYRRYNHRRCIGLDPLAFCRRFSDPADVEIAGFLAAALAYGRVRQITRSLEDLFGRIGPSPARFAADMNSARRERLDGFVHRFNTGSDIADLLTLLGNAISSHGSIEAFFIEGLSPDHENTNLALDSFCRRLLDMHRRRTGSEPSAGLRYLLPMPSAGSACKRLHLFLRWMVRRDAVDPGIWQGVEPARLVVPTDVHMARLSAVLGFHDHKTATMKTALAITRAFACIRPGDPVRYDFALCRIGIAEGCTGRRRDFCDDCELLGFCLARGFEGDAGGAGQRQKFGSHPPGRTPLAVKHATQMEQGI